MPDNNQKFCAHRLNSLADDIGRDGLAGAFIKTLRGETSISPEQIEEVGRALKGYEPELVVILRTMARDLVGERRP